MLVMDLDVAPNQSVWPVRVSLSLDAEGVRGSGFAAVVDIHGEVFRRRAERPGHLGRAGERGVPASRYRRA